MSSEITERSPAKARPATQPAKPARAWRIIRVVVNIALLAAIVVLGCLALLPEQPTRPAVAVVAPPHLPKTVRKARNLDELLKMPTGQLAGVDIAEMNLLCATGLPGSEKLNIDQALAILDDWAKRVAVETERNLHNPTFSRQGDLLPHGEAYRRAEMLLNVLESDLGVRYDLAAKDKFSFKDSRTAFIHGMIPATGQSPPSLKQTPGGTFLSMPVLYVAVGRRLGYPLRLVTAKGHVFVRWDGESNSNPPWRERFNIDIAQGFASYPDGYYKMWPSRLTDKEVSANRYLLSLAPAEELAEFLAYRGHCGLENSQAAFAARCYENAYGYDPKRPCYRDWFVETAMRSGYRTKTPALARLVARRKAVEQQRTDILAGLRRPGGNGDPADGAGVPRPGDPTAAMPGLPGMPQPPRVGPPQPQPTRPGTSRPPPGRTSRLPQPGGGPPR